MRQNDVVLKPLAVGLVAVLSLALLAACQGLSPSEERQQRLDTLAEELQPIIPELMDSWPGLYADFQIYGHISYGQIEGAPDGSTAILTYAYTYAEGMDLFAWWDAEGHLDDQVQLLERTCGSDVFPAMREAGIDGPLGVRYFYRNGEGSPSGQYWEHYCWAEG